LRKYSDNNQPTTYVIDQNYGQPKSFSFHVKGELKSRLDRSDNSSVEGLGQVYQLGSGAGGSTGSHAKVESLGGFKRP
jgi:hypothetical protein